MTKLNCVRCFNDSLGFIKQYIAFHLWQYVGGIVTDSLLSTHDKFGSPVQDNIFICPNSSVHHGTSSCHCYLQKTDFFRFLAQLGIQHVSKSAIVTEMLL